MNTIVLYTKSYRNDLDRLNTCIESVKRHNTENIPYYVSVPTTDLDFFKSRIDTSYVTLIADEEIYPLAAQSWKSQQIVKGSFWKLGVCQNYVMIDSDSYFIKDFCVADFMYDEDTPYTVMHEQKDLFGWTSRFRSNLGFDPRNSYVEDRKKIMDLLGRKGRVFDFGPSPVIWSSTVWKSLHTDYIEPNELTFEKLIEYCPSEFTWYGEYLLVAKPINIVSIEPLFKVFHFAQQYQMFKQLGYSEDDISSIYFGIVLQSNWGAPLRY